MALFPRRSVVYLDECMASSYALIATSVRPEKVTHISRVLRSGRNNPVGCFGKGNEIQIFEWS